MTALDLPPSIDPKLASLIFWLDPPELEELREIALEARARGFEDIANCPDLVDRVEQLLKIARNLRAIHFSLPV